MTKVSYYPLFFIGGILSLMSALATSSMFLRLSEFGNLPGDIALGLTLYSLMGVYFGIILIFHTNLNKTWYVKGSIFLGGIFLVFMALISFYSPSTSILGTFHNILYLLIGILIFIHTDKANI